MARKCCHIGCDKEAEFAIYPQTPNGGYCGFDSCAEHLHEFIDPSESAPDCHYFTVNRIESEEEQNES